MYAAKPVPESPEPKDLRIAIIGAGVGGLATAVALKTAGFPVTVYEHAAALSEVNTMEHLIDITDSRRLERASKSHRIQHAFFTAGAWRRSCAKKLSSLMVSSGDAGLMELKLDILGSIHSSPRRLEPHTT